MSGRTLSVRVEQWPLARPFRISRGTKTVAEAVAVTISEQGVTGRGEGIPYLRYGETGAGVRAAIAGIESAIAQRASREELLDLLPPGAARNAVDCALWDLDVQLGRAALPPAMAVTTALTVGIATPEEMAIAARAIPGTLIKVKVDGAAPEPALRAVRAARPDARLIVDPNESWSIDLLARIQPVLQELAVDFVEQPLPADADEALEGFAPLVPICADESCHITDDLARLRGRYQIVNIKLDKTGGLTEALRLAEAARRLDFRLMVGCMICTSLSIAPALQLARLAEYIDLDGPLWLKADYPGGVTLRDGALSPPQPGFWGEAPQDGGAPRTALP